MSRFDWSLTKVAPKLSVERRRDLKPYTPQQMRNASPALPVKVYTPEERAAWEAANPAPAVKPTKRRSVR